MQNIIPTLTTRQRYWLEHIRACEASGKSMTEYAATEGFPVQTLYASKNILIKKGVLPGVQPARFQRAQVLDAHPDSQWRIGLPNGVSVGFVGEVLWQEYLEQHPCGYQYSWFCDMYRQWRGKLDVVMRQDHRAGELFADYAGQTMPVVDQYTGEIREAQIFIAVLGALRNRTFFSLAELNQVIRELLIRLNNRPFKKLPGSRQEMFASLDQPMCTPTPSEKRCGYILIITWSSNGTITRCRISSSKSNWVCVLPITPSSASTGTSGWQATCGLLQKVATLQYVNTCPSPIKNTVPGRRSALYAGRRSAGHPQPL
ncbi:MAG: transposase [Proteobacteria bacterium]|nr:transposase [Pseudomonadota bacterium]